MIRVTIDLLPGGFEDGKTTLSVIEIANDVTGTLRSGGKYGDYTYRIGRKGGGWGKIGRVVHFNRRNRNAVQLLREVLNNAYGKTP